MKQNSMRKKTALLLALLMLAASAVSCSEEPAKLAEETKASVGGNAAETVAAGVEETTPAETDIPLGIPEGTSYDGATFTLEAADSRGGAGEAIYNAFSLEEVTGETLNDIVYNAVGRVEDLLEIDLVQAFSANIFDYNRMQIYVKSDDGSIDAFSYLDRFGIAQASGGYIIPYEKIPNINLDNPWWYKEVNDAISIAGQHAFAIGAMNLDVVSMMQTIVFNKTMQTNYQLENPFQLVRDGKWTIDKLYELMEKATSDANGDGAWTEDDIYGAVYTHDVWYNNFGPVSGNYIVEKDADDLPVFDVESNETLITIWGKLMDNYEQGTAFYIDIPSDAGKFNRNESTYDSPLYMFSEGHALFSSADSMARIDQLREMENDFGIIPFPHLEEEAPGTAYGSYVNGIGQPYFVPISNIDPARCGHVFEALSYEYYYRVVDQYLDDVAMTKQVRDEDSAEMLRMMYSNKVVDISSGYWWEATNQAMYDVFRSGNNTFVSTYQKISKVGQKTIARTVKMFEEFQNFGEDAE